MTRVWTLDDDGVAARWEEAAATSVYGENWCRLDLTAPALLNPDAPFMYFQEADLDIVAQAGTDFTVAGDDPDNPGRAIVRSAAGGWFQAAMFFGTPGGVTIDGGSPALRWLELFWSLGDHQFPSPNFNSSGLDTFVPVQEGGNGDLASTVLGMPGKALPGGIALRDIGLQFINASGTDAITGALDNSGRLYLWQIA